MKRHSLLILLLFAAGCGDKTILPFLGKWQGQFEVQRMQVPGTESDRKRESLKGYVQVYADKHKFKMRMEGEQEAVDLTGTWSIKRQQITLQFSDVVVDDMGGEQFRDPNRKFIAPIDLRAAYSKPLVLNLSTDKKHLDGLTMTMGGLTGRHVYVKDSF